MLEVIQQAVKPHDRYQVEIKLDYELLNERDTQYRVSTYLFIPQTLGLTPDSYSKGDFYRDVQNYIRLKTPGLGLRELSEGRHAPLAQIERLIQTVGWDQNPELATQVINHCKLLSATLKSAIREHFNLIERRIAEAASGADVQQLIQSLIAEFLLRTDRIAATYRAFFPAFNLPHVDKAVFTAYSLTDESIGLLIEESAIELFPIVAAHCAGECRADFLRQLNERVAQETGHRRAHGYGSLLKVGEENETYMFRASVLKKYAATVLHLTTTVQREGRWLEQLLLAVAAGIAMAFATILAFYVQQNYGNFTFPVFVALVVGYMFKDRIKELGRQLFAGKLQDRLYDRRLQIKTLDGKHKLAIVREKVSFVSPAHLPRPVVKARSADSLVALDNDGQGETIICYTKDVTLFAAAFKRAFAELPHVSGLNDIIRYDIRAYLKKMDEPVEQRSYLANEQLHSVTCHRVYHLNLVSRYRVVRPQKEKRHTRLRLVLNRQGIKRIEHIHV